MPFTVGQLHCPKRQCHLPLIKREIGFLQKRFCNFIEELRDLTQHDFIFSNQFGHRLSRHIAFYFACYIFYCVAIYIPSGVFPAWNTEMFAINSGNRGFPTWLKWRVFNSTLSFLPSLAFAYAIIYVVLPRFYFNKKNTINTIILFAGSLVMILLINYLFAVVIEWNNHRLNPARQIQTPLGKIKTITRGILSTFPIMVGFAVIIKMMKRSWLKVTPKRLRTASFL